MTAEIYRPFHDITARDWQLALGQPGQAVTGLADIAQCLRVILTTPTGSDPLRPAFGSNLWQYVDWPIDQASPHIVRECHDAVGMWEPRVSLTCVQVRRGAEPQHLMVTLHWQVSGQSVAQNVAQYTEVAL